MERYSRPLSDHVKLVHTHAQFLVERLIKYSIRLKTVSEDKQPTIIHKMKAIQEELMIVEDYVKENWPYISETFDVLKEVEYEKVENDEAK
jgi:hypothetical protein